MNNNGLKLTAGEWGAACDSYGKVSHSRKYDCVYSNAKAPGGDRIVTLAGRIPRYSDAKVMAAAKDLYKALKYMNHTTEGGYCICPLKDGLRPDADHATSCADARKAIRKAESNWADHNCAQAEAEWMASYPYCHEEVLP